MKKSIAAKIAKRKFRTLTYKSADKIKRNSTLTTRLPLNCRRKVIPKRLSVTSKTQYEKVHGFKLIDSTILAGVLSSSVVCAKCKVKAIEFQEISGNKKGLSDSDLL